MKILCVSDQIDPLVYSTTVKDRYKDIDAVFCAGDLSLEYVDYIVSALSKPTYFIFGNHNLTDFEYYHKDIFKTAPEIPSSSLDNMEKGHGGDYAGRKVIASKKLFFTLPDGKKTPLLIAGLSGSIKYNGGQAQYSERQMKHQIRRMIPRLLWNKIKYGRYLDIFLTHATPRHIHDKEDPCHKGFECYNWFIKKFKPSLMTHGHIHLYDQSEERVSVSGDTTIVNAYSHIVVDIQEKPVKDSKGDNFGTVVSILSDR